MRFCYFFGKYTFFKIIVSNVSVWLTGISLAIAKVWNVYYHLGLDWSNAAWPIWWLKQSIKPCKLNESVVVITNTRCVYLLIGVWVFYFLKVQKFNLSPTLPLYYTKATWSRVGSVSRPFQMLILRMACSWNLHQT